MSWYDPRDWDYEEGLKGFIGAGPLGGLIGAAGGPSNAQQGMLEDRNRLLAFEQQMQAANPLGDAAQAGVSDFRGDQRDLVSRLQALASGQGPSLAQEQLKQGVDRATNQQYAMAAGARGNPALAQRNAMNMAGALQSQAAGQGAMARAAEQLGALSQLGTATGQGRSMDDAQSQFNTGQLNQFELARMQDAQERNRLRLQALSGAAGVGQAAAQQPSRADQILAFGQGLGGALLPGAGGGGFSAGPMRR